MDPVRPISRTDRGIAPVDLRRLTPLEREEERKRRDRERSKRPRKPPPEDGRSGIDIRV